MNIMPMNATAAETIIEWQYPAPYDLYDMNGSYEAMAELLAGDFYQVREKDDLIGFFCLGNSARIMLPESAGCYEEGYMDVGLGMKPDLCGQGLGEKFLEAAMAYTASGNHGLPFRLSVADFNLRAIRLYCRLGFRTIFRFTRDSDGIVFLVMIRENE